MSPLHERAKLTGPSFNPGLYLFGTLNANVPGINRRTDGREFTSRDLAGLYVSPVGHCVGRYVASSVGTGKAPNLVITEHDPQTVRDGYRLLEFTTCQTIEPGDLLLCDYSKLPRVRCSPRIPAPYM